MCHSLGVAPGIGVYFQVENRDFFPCSRLRHNVRRPGQIVCPNSDKIYLIVSCRWCLFFSFTRSATHLSLPAIHFWLPAETTLAYLPCLEGRRGYCRVYLYGHGLQWLKLKLRLWRIKWFARISCIRVLSPSKYPAALRSIRDAVVGGCVR
jgi:hypothetical protein